MTRELKRLKSELELKRQKFAREIDEWEREIKPKAAECIRRLKEENAKLMKCQPVPK
jgi:hypothetical protein